MSALLTVSDCSALAELRVSAERRGVVTDGIREAMDAGRITPVGLDGRHVCKRLGFAAVYSIEDHARQGEPSSRQKHLSVSIPAATPPSRELVVAIAKVLGFSPLKLCLKPSPEAGWVITHVFEEIS